MTKKKEVKTKEEAAKKIAKDFSKVCDLISECRELNDRFNFGFDFPYIPMKYDGDDSEGNSKESVDKTAYMEADDYTCWNSSSQYC